MSSCPILSSSDSLASVVSAQPPGCAPALGAAADATPGPLDGRVADGFEPDDPEVANHTTPMPSATITATPTASQRSGIQPSGAGRRLRATCRLAVRGASSTIHHGIQWLARAAAPPGTEAGRRRRGWGMDYLL